MFANQRPVITSEFDNSRPVGLAAQARGLLADVWTRLQGARTHPYGPADKDPSTTWNGYAQPPQDFKGLAAPLYGGGLPYRDGAAADISSGLVEGPMGDPARRIFAQRLARRSQMGGL